MRAIKIRRRPTEAFLLTRVRIRSERMAAVCIAYATMPRRPTRVEINTKRS